ncbi:MAG: (2Fe-2S)-binding protein, partial [Bacteroidetes bacterium]
MIEFVLNNTIIKTGANTGMTLLHFIREEQHLMGTKSGCKEGDCGACTVLSGTLQKDHSVIYKSITSCLTPLANVHGKHIVTIEGLNLDNELNV